MEALFRLLFLLLPLVSSLIMPLTKPNGDPDLTSIISHMTLMEQTIADLLTQVHTTTTELTTVKSQLKTAEDEVHALKNDLKSAEADIAVLKHDIEKNPDAVDFALLKSEVEALKVGHNVVIPVWNLTAVDLIDARIKANMKEIHYLKSEVLTTKMDVNKTTHDLMTTQTEVDGFASLAKDTNKNLTQTTADVRSVKFQVNTISAEVNSVTQELLEVKSKTGKNVAFQVSQSTNRNGWTVLRFDKVNYNIGDGYNKTSGMFTAPVSGPYIFWATVQFFSSFGDENISISQGKRKLAVDFRKPNSSIASTSTVIFLDKGNQINFAAGSTNYLIGGNMSSYGGAVLQRLV